MPHFATEPPPAPPGADPGGRDGVQYASSPLERTLWWLRCCLTADSGMAWNTLPYKIAALREAYHLGRGRGFLRLWPLPDFKPLPKRFEAASQLRKSSRQASLNA